jgi:hypothetical protein
MTHRTPDQPLNDTPPDLSEANGITGFVVDADYPGNLTDYALTSRRHELFPGTTTSQKGNVAELDITQGNPVSRHGIPMSPRILPKKDNIKVNERGVLVEEPSREDDQYKPRRVEAVGIAIGRLMRGVFHRRTHDESYKVPDTLPVNIDTHYDLFNIDTLLGLNAPITARTTDLYKQWKKDHDSANITAAEASQLKMTARKQVLTEYAGPKATPELVKQVDKWQRIVTRREEADAASAQRRGRAGQTRTRTARQNQGGGNGQGANQPNSPRRPRQPETSEHPDAEIYGGHAAPVDTPEGGPHGKPGDAAYEQRPTGLPREEEKLREAYVIALEHIGGFYSERNNYAMLPRLSLESLGNLLLRARHDITLEEASEIYTRLQQNGILDPRGNVSTDTDTARLRQLLKDDFGTETPIKPTETRKNTGTGQGAHKYNDQETPLDKDSLVNAVEIATRTAYVTSLILTRELGLSLDEAAKILAELEGRGILGPVIENTEIREVLMRREDLEIVQQHIISEE